MQKEQKQKIGSGSIPRCVLTYIVTFCDWRDWAACQGVCQSFVQACRAPLATSVTYDLDDILRHIKANRLPDRQQCSFWQFADRLTKRPRAGFRFSPGEFNMEQAQQLADLPIVELNLTAAKRSDMQCWQLFHKWPMLQTIYAKSTGYHAWAWMHAFVPFLTSSPSLTSLRLSNLQFPAIFPTLVKHLPATLEKLSLAISGHATHWDFGALVDFKCLRSCQLMIEAEDGLRRPVFQNPWPASAIAPKVSFVRQAPDHGWLKWCKEARVQNIGFGTMTSDLLPEYADMFPGCTFLTTVVCDKPSLDWQQVVSLKKFSALQCAYVVSPFKRQLDFKFLYIELPPTIKLLACGRSRLAPITFPPSLTSMNLDCCQLHSDFKFPEKLETLKLVQTGIAEDLKLPALRSLHLDSAVLSAADLRMSCPKLRELCIGQCTERVPAAEIERAAKWFPSVRHLRFKCYRQKGKCCCSTSVSTDFQWTARSLAAFTNLQSLKMQCSAAGGLDAKSPALLCTLLPKLEFFGIHIPVTSLSGLPRQIERSDGGKWCVVEWKAKALWAAE